MVRIIWSWCGHKFNTFNDGELDGLGYTSDVVFPSWSGHLHQSSIVGGSQEGVGPNVENIAAVAVILAQVAEDLYCP